MANIWVLGVSDVDMVFVIMCVKMGVYELYVYGSSVFEMLLCDVCIVFKHRHYRNETRFKDVCLVYANTHRETRNYIGK